LATTRYLLLVGLIVVAAAVWKMGGSKHGSVKVTGRGDQEEQIVTVTKGDRVDLGDHVAPHGRTIFEFYADWCPGCRMLAPQIEALVQSRDDLSLRKLDIVQWGSDVSQQFAIRSIPYLMLYDRHGELLAEGTREVLEKLQSR
jgi:thiol-disulfide isomerase/thioredoxin